MLWRCHHQRLRADAFNPGMGVGRFHPLVDQSTGGPIPTLYGSDRMRGALSESVFRNVPVSGPAKRVRRTALEGVCFSILAPTRDLQLANLSGDGLRRLGLRRNEFIDSPASNYPHARRWAEAIHRDTPVDGLLWVSRQNDRALAVVLFGDRVGAADLEVVVEALPLRTGVGWHYVLQAAEEADITIVV